MCMIGNRKDVQDVGVVGYRAWKLGRIEFPTPRRPVLRSTARSFAWKKRFVTADRPPRTDEVYNLHGLWAYKTLDKVKAEFRGRDYVRGKIRLTGVVATHEIGARGEVAEILELYVPPRVVFPTDGAYRYHRGQIRRIGKDYGIPVVDETA